MTAGLTLVPSERHVEASHGDGETSTLTRFASRLRAAERLGSPALLREAARVTVEDVPLGGRALRAVDGTTLLDETLSELARAGARGSDLARAGTERGAWLARAMTRFDELLAGTGRADGRRLPGAEAIEGFAARIRDRARAVDDAAQASLTIDVRGDVAFERDGLRFLGELHEQLAPHGGGVRLHLPSIPGAIEALAEVVERAFSDAPVAPDLEWHAPTPPAITTVTECAGPEAEAREVAFHVLRALHDGAPPESIAIVLGEADDTFREPLRAALAEAGVPFSEARGQDVFANPEAKTVLQLLEMADGLLDRDEIVRLLTTPGLHPGSLVREGDEAKAIARAGSLAARVRALPVVRDRGGSLLCDALVAAQRERAADDEVWMVPALESVVSLFTDLRAPHTVASLVTLTLELVTRLRLGEPSARELTTTLAEERATGARLATLPLHAIGQGAVAVRAVTDALRARLDAAATLGRDGRALALRDLADDLRDLLRGFSTTGRGAASRLGTVRVGPLREVVGLDHALLVFPRMTSSAFWVARQRSLLDDATRAALPIARRPRAIAEKNLEQEGLLAWALHSARAVALTFMATGSDGRPNEPPHPAVVAAAARTDVRREPMSRLSRGARVLTARGAELSLLAAGRPPSGDLARRIALEAERAEFFRAARAAPTRASGLVDPARASLDAALGGTSASSPIAVTAIDRALGCPFRAFAERVLRARPLEDLADVHGPRERGMLLHRALHRAFEDDRARGANKSLPDRVARAREVITRELAAEATTPMRRESTRRMVDEATLVFEVQIAEDDPAWRYGRGEQSFGSRAGARFPALELESSDGTRVFVEGVIDRFDDPVGGGSAALVVDYKTGKPSQKSIGTTQMQLPLYASVLRRSGVAEVSAMYVVIGVGGAVSIVPSKVKDQRWDDDRLEDAEAHAADAVVSLWRGAVPPRPESPGLCKRCDSRGLCRRPTVGAATDDDA